MWYASTSSMGTLRYGTNKGRRSVSGCCQTPGTARALAKAGRSRNRRAGGPKSPGLYNAPGPAFRDLPSLARPSLCPDPLQSVTGPVAGVVSQHEGDAPDGVYHIWYLGVEEVSGRCSSSCRICAPTAPALSKSVSFGASILEKATPRYYEGQSCRGSVAA